MNFTKEDLEYLRSLGVDSIDILVGNMPKVNQKYLFDKNFYLSVAKISKASIEADENLSKEEKENYLDIKRWLNDIGFQEPEKMEQDSNEYVNYITNVNAYLTGVDIKLSNLEDIYSKALNLSNNPEEYQKLLDKEQKTAEESAILDAYQDLLASDIVATKMFSKDYIVKYLAYYNNLSSNVNSDLKTKVLQIPNLSYKNFFSAVTKSEGELDENEAVIREFINHNLRDVSVMQDGTIKQKEEFLYGVVFYAAGFIDTKNGKNLADIYNNYLFSNDLSSLESDTYAKEQVVELENQLYEARKIARNNLKSRYNFGINDENDIDLVSIKDYEEANSMPLADIKTKVKNHSKMAQLLNIKEELLSKYPEPENYDAESYKEYANGVRENYIDKILKAGRPKANHDNVYQELNEEQIIADLDKLYAEEDKLVKEREIKAETIATYKKYSEVLLKYANKEELTTEEQEIFDTIKTYNKVAPDADLIEFARNKASEYDELANKLNAELEELRKQSNAIKLAISYLTKELRKIEEEETKVEKVTNRKDLLKKFITFGLGFAGGIALSCVPGVGAIRMTLAGLKLAGQLVSIWTNKHPNGKIDTVITNAKSKLSNKFPRIANGIKVINDKLNSSPLNTFINGVSAGYLVGNIFEMVTGETIFEAINPGEKVVAQTPAIDTPEPSAPQDTTTVITDTTPVTEHVLTHGDTLDLSSIQRGYVASDSSNPVDLITSVGKDAIFDKAVTTPSGEIWYHFKQSNGLGYAWFPKSVIDGLTETGSKSLKF